jgi:hypothetical protein
MTVSLCQRIAGVDYVVSVPAGIQTRPPDAIQSVFASHQPPTDDGIRVDLCAEKLPDLSAWQVLLSNGPGWAIRGRGAQRGLCIGKPAAVPPAGLIACFDGAARRATVYFGPEYFSARPNGVELHHSAGYPVDQMLLIYYLASRQGLLMHAAGLVQGKHALIFPGVSGAGKSTLAQQFLATGGAGLLSDDRIIVRGLDSAWQAYGTPWPGDAGVAVNAGAELTGILFPARGEGIRIQRLSPQAALDRLLPATSILWFEPELLTGQFETCERLLRQVPAFELAWSPGPAIVEFVADLMRRL